LWKMNFFHVRKTFSFPFPICSMDSQHTPATSSSSRPPRTASSTVASAASAQVLCTPSSRGMVGLLSSVRPPPNETKRNEMKRNETKRNEKGRARVEWAVSVEWPLPSERGKKKRRQRPLVKCAPALCRRLAPHRSALRHVCAPTPRPSPPEPAH